MYGDQINFWRDKLGGRRGNDKPLALVDRVLALLLDIDDRCDHVSFWTSGSALSLVDLKAAFESAIDNLPGVYGSTEESTAYEWVLDVCELLAGALKTLSAQERAELMFVPSWREELDTLTGMARNWIAARYMESEQARFLDEAQSAAEKAISAAVKAQESAGVAGSSSLSTHFSTYASGERIAANTFRVLSILSVVGALLAAIALGPVEAGNWTQLTYRLATVAAAGTLAAYFARQAGQHRRVYNWAKSLEVQLKSFPAFVEPIPEEQRVEIYRSFARRVLSAPPEKGADTNEDSAGAAQLLDIITALAKRV
ncbi:hypothetical protein B0I12_002837 [Microbacterium hydrothermale]|uniref:hypothetical protein n=1 Tax=Microbacterium hydrothermale TaxID=857427 RepID=UPI0022273901|nr:hypothetical protein [Microbacterium hydrothermale]MCW2165672.1 hypothetical protein [Microbacterium hydrothermale]